MWQVLAVNLKEKRPVGLFIPSALRRRKLDKRGLRDTDGSVREETKLTEAELLVISRTIT